MPKERVVGDAGPMADLGPEALAKLAQPVMDNAEELMMNPPSIAIIGGGWYGCHVAKILKEKGAKITVFERENDVFAGSSAKHQFRLHVGFHYPRAYLTRMQILESFERFQEVYPDFFINIDDNIYCVAENDSLLDFGTYQQIVEASKLPFQLINPTAMGIHNVGGAMKCQERGLICNAPRLYFRELLKDNLRLNTHVENIVETKGTSYTGEEDTKVIINDEEFDWVVNCTYNQSFPMPHLQTFYEVCLTLIYKDIRPLAVSQGKTFAIDHYHGWSFPLAVSVHVGQEIIRRRRSLIHSHECALHTSQAIFVIS